MVAQHHEAFKGPWQFVAKITSVMQKEARRCRSEVGTERGAESSHRLQPPNSWSHQLHYGEIGLALQNKKGGGLSVLKSQLLNFTNFANQLLNSAIFKD